VTSGFFDTQASPEFDASDASTEDEKEEQSDASTEDEKEDQTQGPRDDRVNHQTNLHHRPDAAAQDWPLTNLQDGLAPMPLDLNDEQETKSSEADDDEDTENTEETTTGMEEWDPTISDAYDTESSMDENDQDGQATRYDTKVSEYPLPSQRRRRK
jgi:hypothetical protein